MAPRYDVTGGVLGPPLPMTVWCDQCGLPLDCPQHGHGVPVRTGEDDWDIQPCKCNVKTCECHA